MSSLSLFCESASAMGYFGWFIIALRDNGLSVRSEGDASVLAPVPPFLDRSNSLRVGSCMDKLLLGASWSSRSLKNEILRVSERVLAEIDATRAGYFSCIAGCGDETNFGGVLISFAANTDLPRTASLEGCLLDVCLLP